ncbi:MAG: glycosyl hydrolase family 18 protein [Tenericutes bacterium]|nr:glycosyl hydrolase family 18 protein [Mycoplasmatota bacterium]
MTFVVSFDVGLGSDVDSISVASGSSMSLPITEREGYNFLGWTLIDTAEAEIVDEPFQPNSNITLYAKWSVNQYTISFNTNGGSVIDPITQDYGTDILQPDVPTKEGDTFGGWYSDSELTTAYTFSTMPSENITVYAKWDAIDWSDVEPYLINLIPNELSNNISLPSTYLDYSISWLSSHPEILSNAGIYIRPYQATTVSLSAIIQLGQQTLTKIYNIEVDGYKSLSAPLTSSYIYRDYNLVSDSFFTTLDIINCAFITANSAGTLSGTAVLGNINTYIMPKAHENGNWVIFSIAPDSDWSAIASNSNRINTFADNIVAMINAYGFDGVDIDWETPTTEEATRFTEMMRVIYTKVKANNPNHLVTAAIAGGMWQPPRYDLVNSQQYLDYINMMTYGMVSNNGYYQNALSRSTTYDNPTNSAGKTLTSCSIEESIDIYHSYGIPNSKIIVGVAFYGIKQTRSYDVSSQTWSNWVNAGSVSYNYIINNYLNNSSYDYNYDTQAGVPYIIKTDGTVFISYDNPRSIADKSEYIIENGLAGMMYWENGLDLSGTLLLAMEVGLIEID